MQVLRHVAGCLRAAPCGASGGFEDPCSGLGLEELEERSVFSLALSATCSGQCHGGEGHRPDINFFHGRKALSLYLFFMSVAGTAARRHKILCRRT